MPKNVYTPQLKKVHKQQELLLQQMAEMKGDISSLLHSIRNIELQLSKMQNKPERKKRRLFSFVREKQEKKKETATSPLSGLGDFNMVQVMELMQNPAIQKMIQRFMGS